VIDTAGKLYGVLYLDAPWRYETWSAKARGRNAENHYSTMSIAEIKALELPATRSAACFLWAIPAMLEHALGVIRHWGFTPKSQMLWVKPSIGLGKCFRNRHEILLYGTRGRLPRLAYRPDSVIEAPRGRHSEKPAAFADAIVKMYPDLLRIEIFARVRREHWDSWGDELGPDPWQGAGPMSLPIGNLR
jgi:N6-adenosine-specific RNA methylase IME4